MIVMEFRGGTAVFDECGICDGPGADDYYDCAGNCLSDVVDLVCDMRYRVGAKILRQRVIMMRLQLMKVVVTIIR